MTLNTMQLASPGGTASMLVDCASGGRLESLMVDGRELLAGRVDDPLNWGLYPMVPFAGRVRDGLVVFDGESTQLPQTMVTHAIHGYGFVSSWTATGATEISFDFAQPWPWRGRATQRFGLADDSLTITMEIDAIDRQPMQVGWHPWFRRDIGVGTPAELDFTPAVMFERDPGGIPSGQRIVPTSGPWDDCFTDLASNPVLRWGDFSLELSATADHWTVYDQPDHALCVEPQTGPPNQINDDPQILEPGETMMETFTLRWR